MMKTNISKCDARRPKYRKKITYSIHLASEGDWCKEDSQYYWTDENWGGYSWEWLMKRHNKEKVDEQD